MCKECKPAAGRTWADGGGEQRRVQSERDWLRRRNKKKSKRILSSRGPSNPHSPRVLSSRLGLPAAAVSTAVRLLPVGAEAGRPREPRTLVTAGPAG